MRRDSYECLLFKCSIVFAFLYFFFFQAEDGIRDYKVTGVQTCALPISEIGAVYDPGRWYGGERVVAEVGHWQITLDSYAVSNGKTTHVFTRLRAPYRSEERRVGEEGRSRWAPYH